MTAHLRVPAWDPAPATLSRRILTGVLREQLGFDGLVVTDGLEMAAIRATVGLAAGAVRAIAAGADAVCVGGGLADEDAVELLACALVEAVRDGALTPERLAEAAERVTATARWAASHRPEGERPARTVGLEAARRAVRARGVASLAAAPVVAELRPAPGMAAGAVPWGIAAVLAERDPAVTALRLEVDDPPPHPGPPPRGEREEEDPAGVEGVLAAAAGRPLVLVCRDLHRHPHHAAAVDAILDRRPDAVVVEMGLPAHPPAAARSYVATHGAGRVNALAAADLLCPGVTV